NGNGWCHCARVTRVRNRTGISLLCSEVSARPNLWGQVRRLRSIAATKFQKEQSTISCCRSADIYIQEFISAQDSRRLQPSFVLFFRSFDLLCMPSFAEANDGLTEK